MLRNRKRNITGVTGLFANNGNDTQLQPHLHHLQHYTRRFVSSTRRDRKPARFSRNGSGLPMPLNGLRVASRISRLVRFSVFYPVPAGIGSLPGQTEAISAVQASASVPIIVFPARNCSIDCARCTALAGIFQEMNRLLKSVKGS